MKDIMKARKRDTPEKPPAALERREGDFELPGPLYLVANCFAKLKTKPQPDKYPGTLVLRSYAAGQVICRQGDPGWTAFAILKADDVAAFEAERRKLLRDLPARIEKSRSDLEAARVKNDATMIERKEEEINAAEALTAALAAAKLPPPLPAATGPAASVFLETTAGAGRKKGWFERWFGRKDKPRRRPKNIAIDAPTTLEYGTKKATLPEGALFGQWSCIYGTPRSATIRAERPVYVLEMLRNVLDAISRDPNFQEATDKEYRAGVLANHLRNLDFFADLPEERFEALKKSAELERYRDGQIIFDKGDASDCMYIVRRGLVKVLLNEWPLLAPEDVRDAKALAALASSDAPAAKFLAAKLGPALPSASVAEINARLKDRELTLAPNEKTKKMEAAPDLEALLDGAKFKAALAEGLPAKQDDWSHQDWRRYNRLVLETAAPGALRSVRPIGDARALASENILTYMTQGEFFGEMGVVLKQPRSATCVAYVHPRPDADKIDAQGDRWRREEEQIELVKIPAEVFFALYESDAGVRAKVDEAIAARGGRSEKRMTAKVVDEDEPAFQSDKFQELGLVQGQKLMLIDLERCTRCDECVQACIATHNDGRTRLFLDGPRFGNYLVPATCRSCRDPVCLIGCPVGSIRRGNNLEIIIEDWCIGCQLCAKNCPYGSIQMHDLGILPEDSHGWRLMPAGRAAAGWEGPGFKAKGWIEGAAPFLSDEDFLALVRVARGQSADEAICFLRDFTLESLGEAASFKLSVDTNATDARVEGTGRAAKVAAMAPLWLNGIAAPVEKWKAEQGQFVWAIEGEDVKTYLRPGRNTLAVRATPPAKRGVLLQVAIDEVRGNGAVIPLRAVVCDQCSTLADQLPSCVVACPHDAAKRVNAWTGFPTTGPAAGKAGR